MTSSNSKFVEQISNDFFGVRGRRPQRFKQSVERPLKHHANQKTKSRDSVSTAKKTQGPEWLSQLLKLAEDRGYVLVKEIKAAPSKPRKSA